MDIKKLVTREEVASEFNVHTNTIYNWTRGGHIRSYKLGPRLVRYDMEEVNEDIINLIKKGKHAED